MSRCGGSKLSNSLLVTYFKLRHILNSLILNTLFKIRILEEGVDVFRFFFANIDILSDNLNLPFNLSIPLHRKLDGYYVLFAKTLKFLHKNY